MRVSFCRRLLLTKHPRCIECAASVMMKIEIRASTTASKGREGCIHFRKPDGPPALHQLPEPGRRRSSNDKDAVGRPCLRDACGPLLGIDESRRGGGEPGCRLVYRACGARNRVCDLRSMHLGASARAAHLRGGRAVWGPAEEAAHSNQPLPSGGGLFVMGYRPDSPRIVFGVYHRASLSPDSRAPP